ncbi:DUF4148 domain-containing protein [Undibacterium oligocarboniphilum]|uniref:DUF4148 domain-containing protein n=1 Tax=Undibacterium oligocarboniphilum TaxID=666702 RepID=A0A850QDW0_9BURK|nr:DUF4148 domain-containing protein [Undibacterium oligocarboniphilum]MBC3870557.1 DUF4148 domain-containing protein [Undibacterium oligocarboniphilum]NVO78642.1 DUF4148 domain-containing protein [Undibacterium oligocarboniphilum]
MTLKKIILASTLIAFGSNAAIAAETSASAAKTRAEVIAELVQARADGEEIGSESFIWYPAQKAARAKANEEVRLTAAKAGADNKVTVVNMQKTQQN